ncbi:hypothetical protein STANM309S_05783 [Streptomyces tanashiensis]
MTCPRWRRTSPSQQIENRRDSDLEARAKKLENDLAELEAEGAKADVRRKVREGAEREMKQLRDRAQREIDRLDEVWSRFKNLEVEDLEGDELLYRELRDRFGTYFDGSMGAAALQKRLESFDLDEEAVAARSSVPARARRRPVRSSASRSSPRSCRPRTAPRAWFSTACRSSRRTCVRWCSWTVAASRPPT